MVHDGRFLVSQSVNYLTCLAVHRTPVLLLREALHNPCLHNPSCTSSGIGVESAALEDKIRRSIDLSFRARPRVPVPAQSS